MNDIETNELDTICGLTDEELTERFKEAIHIDNEIKRIKGLPFFRYDEERKWLILNILTEEGSIKKMFKNLK